MRFSRTAISLSLIVFTLCTIPYWNYITDDTYIALRYSKHLASGDGFSYNVGDPSYGFTSPLWVMLLALFKMLGADLVLSAKFLGVGFGLASLWILCLLLRKTVKITPFAFLAPLLFAYDPWFIRWSSSGMETSLALFLLLSGFLLYLREEANGSPLSSLLFGLATLARPEAGLFFVLVLIESLLRQPRRRKAWQSVLGYLLIVFPWILFSLVQFGTLSPYTLKVKYGVLGGLSFIVSLATKAGKIIGGTYLPYILLIATALIFTRFRSHLKPYLVPLVWVVLLPLFYVVGRFPPASRYLLLSFPFIVLLGFLSLDIVSSGWTIRRRSQLTVALSLVILGTNTYLGWFLNYPNSKGFAQGMEDCHIYIGRWLKSNTSPDATIAAGDIGAIGYYSERRILDLGALTNPDLVPLVTSYPHRKIVEEGLYLDVAEADYLVDRTTAPFSLIQGSEAGGLYEPLFYRSTPTLGLTFPHSRCYYSVYEVKKRK